MFEARIVTVSARAVSHASFDCAGTIDATSIVAAREA